MRQFSALKGHESFGAHSIPSQRDSMIVARHEVPGTALPQEPSRRDGMIRAGVRTGSMFGVKEF